MEPAGTPENGDKKIEFVYDYMGRRIEKKVSTHNGSSWSVTYTRRFVWSDWLLVLELDATDPNDVTVLRKYTWGLDLGGTGASPLIDSAGGVGGLLAAYDADSSKDYLYFHDANGNVGQLIDRSDGSIAAKYEYDAYGNNLLDPSDPNESGPYADDSPFRFSTKYWDDETGLGYWGYRYYSPRLGRWTNREPLGELASRNLYRAFRNSACLYYDYLGSEDEPVSGVDDPPQSGESPPASGPATQPAIDTSKACCLYSEEYVAWGKGGKRHGSIVARLQENCYKERNCPPNPSSPEDCCGCVCPRETMSTRTTWTLLGADWGKCCFCTVSLRNMEPQSGLTGKFPHRGFAITCPSYKGNPGFSRVYSFEPKAGAVGPGIVRNLPFDPDDIGYTWRLSAKRIPCSSGYALKDRMDACYPKKKSTPHGRYILGIRQCYWISQGWWASVPSWKPCSF